jgi:hypothetical protein
MSSILEIKYRKFSGEGSDCFSGILLENVTTLQLSMGINPVLLMSSSLEMEAWYLLPLRTKPSMFGRASHAKESRS